MLERLLRANEDQAEATGALVEINRETRARLESIERTQFAIQGQAATQTTALLEIVKHLESMDLARGEAIVQLGKHVDVAVKRGFLDSESWWRRTAWVMLLLIAASNLIGVAVSKFIEWLPK